MQQQYLKTDEAVELLRISKSTLYKMTSAKVIPFHKMGRILLFKKADLIDFVESGKTIEIKMIEKELENLENLRLPSLAA